jgi:hypothetical protein
MIWAMNRNWAFKTRNSTAMAIMVTTVERKQ